MSTTTTTPAAQPAQAQPAKPVTKKPEAVEPPAPWGMPDAEIGDFVWWYADGKRGDRPSVAIVTALGMQSLNLNIISPMHYEFKIRDGVRHLDDPRTKQNEKNEVGAWEHTPQRLRLNRLEELVARMAKDLNYQKE